MNSRSRISELSDQGEVPAKNCDWCGKFTSKWVVELDRDYGDTLYFCSQGCEDNHSHEEHEWGNDMGDLEEQYGTRGNTL